MEYLLSSEEAAGFIHLPETGSTNRDLLERAKDQSLPEFFVISTDFQTQGRGRLDRSWEAEPGSSVMASILLRPKFQDSSRIGWLPLVAALAISETLEAFGITSKVKWPNDVLIGEKKVSGILAEASEDLSFVVIGFGINVSQPVSKLPVENATSLLVATGSYPSRDQILKGVISNLKKLYLALAESTESIRDLAISASATIGSKVKVVFPEGREVIGQATDIDAAGRLLVLTATETLTVSAGDVLHLRSL